MYQTHLSTANTVQCTLNDIQFIGMCLVCARVAEPNVVLSTEEAYSMYITYCCRLLACGCVALACVALPLACVAPACLRCASLRCPSPSRATTPLLAFHDAETHAAPPREHPSLAPLHQRIPFLSTAAAPLHQRIPYLSTAADTSRRTPRLRDHISTGSHSGIPSTPPLYAHPGMLAQ